MTQAYNKADKKQHFSVLSDSHSGGGNTLRSPLGEPGPKDAVCPICGKRCWIIRLATKYSRFFYRYIGKIAASCVKLDRVGSRCAQVRCVKAFLKIISSCASTCAKCCSLLRHAALSYVLLRFKLCVIRVTRSHNESQTAKLTKLDRLDIRTFLRMQFVRRQVEAIIVGKSGCYIFRGIF